MKVLPEIYGISKKLCTFARYIKFNFKQFSNLKDNILSITFRKVKKASEEKPVSHLSFGSNCSPSLQLFLNPGISLSKKICVHTYAKLCPCLRQFYGILAVAFREALTVNCKRLLDISQERHYCRCI